MNTEDFTAKLNGLKKIYDKAKEDRLRAEQDQANCQNRLRELEGKCRELGVEPERLEQYIEETNAKLEAAIREIEQSIPPEYLAGCAPPVSGAGRLRADWEQPGARV